MSWQDESIIARKENATVTEDPMEQLIMWLLIRSLTLHLGTPAYGY